jgi:outer membrane protein OmpA-like peptidoglycan-associated protein
MSRSTALLLGALVCGCSPRMPSTKMVGLEPAARPLACAADADCGSAQLCVDRSCFDVATATAASCAESPIHFATNSARIDSRNRAELNQLAVCLRTDRAVRVNLAGNADERGNRDYNRTLAQRRADTVAGYLESAGVKQSQLSTLAYGADNPMCTEHDADCWRQNRRVEIQPRSFRASSGEPIKNKITTDQDTKQGGHIDSTGNGTDNGSPLGK